MSLKIFFLKCGFNFIFEKKNQHFEIKSNYSNKKFFFKIIRFQFLSVINIQLSVTIQISSGIMNIKLFHKFKAEKLNPNTTIEK